MALEIWNGRTPGQTDADSPLDTTLLDGIRKDLDHLKQVLYGSTDPSFHTPIWGHNHDGANSALITSVADGAVPLAKLYPASYTVGSKLKQSHNGEATTSSLTPVKMKEITIQKGGTFRIKADIKNGGIYGWTWIEFRKNDVIFGAWLSNQGSTYVTKSLDLGPWAAGDRIGLYMYNDGNGAFVKNFRLYAAEDEIEFSNTM